MDLKLIFWELSPQNIYDKKGLQTGFPKSTWLPNVNMVVWFCFFISRGHGFSAVFSNNIDLSSTDVSGNNKAESYYWYVVPKNYNRNVLAPPISLKKNIKSF